MTSWHRVVHDRHRPDRRLPGAHGFGAGRPVVVQLRRPALRGDPSPHFADLSFDQTLPPCEDWDLWLRCAQQQPVGVVPRVLYSYHQHGGDRVTKEGPAGGAAARRSSTSTARDDRGLPRLPLGCRGRGVGRPFGLARLAPFVRLGQPGAPRSFAGSVLATTYATSTVGIRRGDPGLPARAMHRLLHSSKQGVAPTRR